MSVERIDLQAGKLYYFKTRANGHERIFEKEEEYVRFLQRFGRYIAPVAHCFGYCLLPRSVEFCIRVKSFAGLEAAFQLIRPLDACSVERLPAWLMKQCSNLLNSYAKTFNHEHDRVGALFVDRIHIKELESADDLLLRLCDMHLRPVADLHCSRPADWRWSSYSLLLAEGPCWLSRDLLWRLIKGRDRFINLHQRLWAEG